MQTCIVYNFAQQYRANIFTLMDQQLDIDFYFGDHYLNVKKMDYNLLKHKVTEVRNLHFGPLSWQTGIVQLAFNPYKKYIMLGEPMCLSIWLLLIFGRLHGKEMYFWTHGWYGKETWIKKVIKKAFFGLATGTMTYGNYACSSYFLCKHVSRIYPYYQLKSLVVYVIMIFKLTKMYRTLLICP